MIDCGIMNDVLVESWNEWDPLEEIVVGTAVGACFSPTEPGHQPKIRDPHIGANVPWPRGPKKASIIDAAERQLEGLAELLRSEGVIVKRPPPQRFDVRIQTPTFEVPNMYCATCPRDVMITIGREIIEAPMSRRARFFEYLSYRPLVQEYFCDDPGMAWTAAPKPSMADEMYEPEFWERTLAQRHADMHAYRFCVTNEEPLFDAADMTRMGKDVFVQESMTTNAQGISWLTRHLESRGLRVTALHFPYDLFPSHIDCTFVPLRPGLILTNPERPLVEQEARLFREHGWRLVDAPQPVSSNDEMPAFCQSSKWLSMNVLSLGPNKVICEAREAPLIQLLKELNFEVIELPFRDVFEFGGSLHCATWDIRRSGSCEDYFPNYSSYTAEQGQARSA